MGKTDKTGLGRALVKHHNNMILQSKEKGGIYRKQNKTVLQSVTEVSDIEAVIGQAEEAERLYSFDHPPPNLPINLDTNANSNEMTSDETRNQQMIEEELHAGSLKVPRRPPWKAGMSVEELDNNEKQAFLVWRRSLARLEENENLVLTPFEKNLDIWRQLWRVVERSDLLVMVVDARDPMFYRCPDLEAYAQEVDEHKKTLLLINKADLLPSFVRELWAKYFRENDILFLFWSAKAATALLEGKKLNVPLEILNELPKNDNTDAKIYGRDDLLTRLQSEAEKIAMLRNKPVSIKNVVVGFVGYPNVGKSSTINALVGVKKTGVTSTPGKTKHFQTLIISDELTLCDCPGLVFPSFSSSRYEMIAYGVLPIDRMTEHREAIQIVANRVPRHVIEQVYNITLPKPKSYEVQSRHPFAAELLKTYCSSRGHVITSGLPDETRAARQILKDYIDGKLLHYELPPGMSREGKTVEIGQGSGIITEVNESDEEFSEGESEDETENAGPGLEHALSDLNSFDVANGISSNKTGASKKKEKASHKHHKKTQRTKDRSWRVGNDDGDGMPVVRVFQKQINTGPPLNVV